MTLSEMKQIYIGLHISDDGFCFSRMKFDKRGTGRRVYIDDSWYHMDMYWKIDDIGGPVTDRFIDAIEDSMSWSEFQEAKKRKEQIRKETDIPPGWFLMSDWVNA